MKMKELIDRGAITVEDVLIASGYKKYPPPHAVYATALYQKKINDTLFINILEYPHSDPKKIAFEIEATYELLPDGPWMSVKAYSYDEVDLLEQLDTTELRFAKIYETSMAAWKT